jgi:hypothetical protein
VSTYIIGVKSVENPVRTFSEDQQIRAGARSGGIDVFDGGYNPVTSLTGTFTDPSSSFYDRGALEVSGVA